MGNRIFTISNPFNNVKIQGFQVLKIQDGSPSQHCLEEYFDFIIAIDDIQLTGQSSLLAELLATRRLKPVSVSVYNARRNAYRRICVVPSDEWGGDGLLGISIRFCSLQEAHANCWHVIRVAPQSPAQRAGLTAQSDYIVGLDTLLPNSEAIFEHIELSQNVQMHFFVYNSESRRVRDVYIVPTNHGWPKKLGSEEDGKEDEEAVNSQSVLGCDIGYGALHCVPTSSDAELPSTNQKSEPNHAPIAIPAPSNQQVSELSFQLDDDSAANKNLTKSMEKPEKSVEQLCQITDEKVKIDNQNHHKTNHNNQIDLNGVAELPPMINTDVCLPGLPPITVCVAPPSI